MVSVARDSLGHFTGHLILHYGRGDVRNEPDTGGSPDQTWWVVAFDHIADEEEIRLALNAEDTNLAWFHVLSEGHGTNPGSWREILSLIQEHEGVEEDEAKSLLREAESRALRSPA